MQNKVIPIKAVAYLRRSTRMQEQSIFNQKRVIEKFAQRHDFEIIKYFIDDGISGTGTKSRKAFLDMIFEGTNGNCSFSAILCLDCSRWSRGEPDEAAFFEWALRKRGIKVLFVAEPMANDGSIGDHIVKALKRVLAAEFSKDQAKKTIRGSITYTKLGYSVGGCPPYGYDRLLVDKDGKSIKILKPGQRKSEKTEHVRYVLGDPEKVKVVKEIFDMVANQGLGLRQVCKKLNQAKIPASKGGLWDVSSMRNTIQNPVYTGLQIWNRANRCYTFAWSHDTIDVKIGEKKTKATRWKNREQWVVGESAHEPIIDKKLFDEAQKMLATRKKYFSVGKMPKKNVSKKEQKKLMRRNLILSKIRTHVPFSLVALAENLKVNKKTIERDIEELKREGKVRFIGPKRWGHYKLLKNCHINMLEFPDLSQVFFK